MFRLQVYFYANQTHFHVRGFARKLCSKIEAQGNVEMAYVVVVLVLTCLSHGFLVIIYGCSSNNGGVLRSM